MVPAAAVDPEKLGALDFLYGGVGINLNHARGMRDSTFGGWLLQRTFGQRLTLGGEVFRQNAQAMSERGYTLLNLGGYYNFTADFSLLFSAGRSVAGAQHTVAYLGLCTGRGLAEAECIPAR